MNKRVEYQGSPINVPEVLSGIQDIVEKYFGDLVSSLNGVGGIVYSSTNDPNSYPCKLYTVGGDLRITAGTLIFPQAPYYLYKLQDTLIGNVDTIKTVDGEFLDPEMSYYVSAKITKKDAGVQKKIISAFVLDPSNPTKPSEVDDTVYFEFSSTKQTTGQVIPLGLIKLTVGTIYGIDQQPGVDRNYIKTALLPRFLDNILILNDSNKVIDVTSTLTGMIAKIGNSSTGSLLLGKENSTLKWVSNLPIKGITPKDQQDLTTVEWVQEYVTKASIVPPNVLNLRLVDIYSSAASTEDFVSKEATTNNTMLQVYLKWGWDDLYGTCTNGVFTVQNPDVSFSIDQLKDQSVWLTQVPSDGQREFYVRSNTDKTITLNTLDGNPYTGSWAISGASATRAWIHMNADRYQISVTPYGTDGKPITAEERIIEVIGSGTGPTKMEAVGPLLSGAKYFIRVRNTQGGKVSLWTDLPATGTYTPSFGGPAQSYANPLVVRHAPLTDTPEHPSIEATRDGFIVRVVDGWAGAEKFEVGWTTDVNSVEFPKMSTTKMFVSRTMDVTVGVQKKHYVLVRPIICGIQVATPMRFEVVTGAFGSGSEVTVTTQKISHKTYSGKLTYSSTSKMWYGHFVQYPAGGSYINPDVSKDTDTPGQASYLPEAAGEVMTVNGKDYLIKRNGGGTYPYIELAAVTKMDGSTDGPPPTDENATYDFTVGTSKTAREQFRVVNYPYPVQLTKVVLTDVIHYGGDPVTVRVYQVGPNPDSTCDYLTPVVDNADQLVSETDLVISGSDKSIVLDLWDPAAGTVRNDGTTSTGLNKGGISATVTIYGLAIK